MKYRAQAFLLMPFDESLNSLRDAIIAAGDAVRVHVERADDIFRAGIVIEQIKEKIRTAGVIIAVCTGQNPNVFFELGIADQWHWPILLAEKKTDLPFDVQHYRALIYGEYGEDILTKALAAAIGATLDGGKKDRAAVDAAAPPPRAEPRVLGRFISQVHVWGLEREGSLEHFPVDLLFLVEDVRSEVDQKGRALAKDFPRREGVMSPPWRVTQEAEESGLIQKNYDPDAGEWYLLLTEKGWALLKAYARFSEEKRRRQPDR